MDRAKRYRRLRVFNLAVGATHLTQAAVILALSNDVALPVLATFLAGDPVSPNALGRPSVVFELPVGPLVAVFLFLAAVDHLLVAAPRVVDWYQRKLDERSNDARWLEYSISASVMVVLIAAFAGIRDLAALTAIFALNVCMILFGILMERQQEPGSADWSAFWFGLFAGAIPWILLAFYIISAGGAVPGYVHVLYGLQLLLFWSFAMNMVLQYEQIWRWRDYVFGEYAYVALSLGAKSLLAWLVFANVLYS